MNIKDMIEILQAAERGERIEFEEFKDVWLTIGDTPSWNFYSVNYRIAPTKHELSLVEELRTLNPQFYSEWKDIAARAADRITDLQNELADCVKRHAECYTLLVDKTRRLESYEIAETQYREDLIAKTKRIEELEGFSKKSLYSLYCYTTDELLAEIKRRTE